jgi:protease IV
MKKPSRFKSWIILLFLFALLIGFWKGLLSGPNHEDLSLSRLKMNKSHVLVHEFKGVITDSKKWIEKVDTYVKRSSIKAVVLIVNSPGGIVGPSQELYHFIKKIRSEYGKPVVVYSGTVLASGAYYLALGADQIITSPGAMVGSIGVIMEFLNLEGIYDWAKVRRFSISSGKFKDSGAEYRPMRDEERDLFQSLIQDVYDQFVTTIKEERKLDETIIKNYADGRILTGLQAQKAGLTDAVGYLDQAIQAASLLAQQGKLEPFHIPKENPSILDFLSRSEEADTSTQMIQSAIKLLRTETVGLPLYLLPSLSR